jgi:hypothetical protein
MATQVTQPVEPEVKNNQPEIDPESGKFIYTYQPRDSEGQFIGKPYKFLYTDHQDLVRQLTDAKENGDRFIYEVKSGKRKLQGEPAVPRPEFTPAPESTEEVDRKRREEFRKTAKEEFGADPEDVRQALKKATLLEEGITAYHWALNKQADGYYPCPENGKKIAAWLKEKNLANTPANYDLAFEELKDTLVQAPKEQEPADSTQQPPTRAEVRPQSTGIIPGQFAGTRQPNRMEKRPLAVERFRQIDRMSRDQWNRLLRDNRKEAEAYLAMKNPAQPQ